jgi:C_GCAxxG_C_C family probable redox protein
MENNSKVMFAGPYNCAQSVFGQFAEQFGLEREVALRIATPFGGGIGHSGQLCGAVSGAILAIGLAQGTGTGNKPQKEACYALVRAFIERFEAKHGSITCPDLLGVDLADPVEYERAHELDLFQTRCADYISDAVRITAELLKDRYHQT